MMKKKINDFMAQVEAKNPNEPEFIQAVREFAETVIPLLQITKNTTEKIYCCALLSPKEP